MSTRDRLFGTGFPFGGIVRGDQCGDGVGWLELPVSISPSTVRQGEEISPSHTAGKTD